MRRTLLMSVGVLLSFFGCHGTPSGDGEPAFDTACDGAPCSVFVSAPTLTLRDDPNTPLSAVLTVQTTVPTRLGWRLVSDRHASEHSPSDVATTHSASVLDLRPGLTHTLTVSATDDSGQVHTWDGALQVVPPELPPDFPPLTTTTSLADRMAPGLTLVALPTEVPGASNFLVVLDAAGEVAWLHRADEPIRAVTPLSDGRLALLLGRERIQFLYPSGEVDQTWAAGSGQWTGPADVAVDAFAFHHELIELDQGHLAVLSAEVRSVPDYPLSEEANPPVLEQNVVGDVLLELDPTGEVVGRWALQDQLDPTRVGRDAVLSEWWSGYLGGTQRDWSHSNSVDWDPDSNDFLLSVRHQDALVRFNRDSGEPVWIVGPKANWTAPWIDSVLDPATDLEVSPYHGHGANFGPDGTVVVFDNHNWGASAGEPPLPVDSLVSRAVVLDVDPVAGTWRTAFAFSDLGATPYYDFGGDADLLKNGNLLFSPGHAWKGPANLKTGGQVFEVDPADGSVVFHVEIPDGWTGVDRVQRIPSLYQWVP